MNELKELAGYSHKLRLENVPEDVVTVAKYCMLDTIGSALGAAGYEEIPDIVKQVQSFSGENSGNFASLWGHNQKAPVFQAILVNGIMGHALELDDVHTHSKSHIGAVVLPAAWTAAESLGANGAELLESVIAGYEVMARIGKGFGVSSHRQKGWHVTGTAGTFGAAAASAKLLNLTEAQTISALGMAGTQSSGLWAFLEDGATCKKLHPARSAVNGFVAALLAKSGMTGPEHILDAQDGGLYRATSDAFDLKEVSGELGSRYELLNLDKKPYPCCRSTHCAIDAMLHVGATHELSSEQIESIVVSTYAIGVKQCGSSRYPKTPAEAKFSTPYVVAAALEHEEVTLTQFTDAYINSDILQKIAGRVTVREAADFTSRYPDHWGCAIEVTLTTGETIEHEVVDASGSVFSPLTDDQSKAKFVDLCAPQIGEEESFNLMHEILSIEQNERIPAL